MVNVVFAHNVYNRFVTLRDTINTERNYFPSSRIAVAYNGDFINLFSEIKNIDFIRFEEKTHKIGCVNGSILSIKNLLNKDFDVLIFSHDDVYINPVYFTVVNEHINSLVNGEYDIVCRKPNKDGWGENYYMMEVFYITKKAAIELFGSVNTYSNEQLIPKDIRNSISPEVWLYNLFTSKNFKINAKEYQSRLDTYNIQLGMQMGYFHKNIGVRGWKD